MTPKGAIEKLSSWLLSSNPNTEISISAIGLAIRALDLVDRLGLWDGEEVSITEAAGSRPSVKMHHVGDIVDLCQYKDQPSRVDIRSPMDGIAIPQLLRELAAAYDFLKKSGKHWEGK